VSLNVVCFRFVPPGTTGEEQDAFNKELLLRVQETGLAIISGSRIAGRYVMRVACSNHRSRWEDFESLAVGLERLAANLLSATRA